MYYDMNIFTTIFSFMLNDAYGIEYGIELENNL